MQKYMLLFFLAASAICVVIGITRIIFLIVRSSRWEGGASMRIRTLQEVVLEESDNPKPKSDSKPHDTSDADAQPEADRPKTDQPKTDQPEADRPETDQPETELLSSNKNAGE